jgi:hypothetical protein
MAAGRKNAGRMPALRWQSRLSLSYPLPFSFGNRQYSTRFLLDHLSLTDRTLE